MKYEMLGDKILALFFSCGVSLKTWHDIGMIDREVAIYNELSGHFKHIYFFTYGDEDDLRFKSYLADNITIIPKKYISNSLLYSFMLPIIHHKTLKNVDILKTNQMSAAWSAALTKLIFRSKLVVRTGFMWSVNFTREYPKSRKKLLIKGVERFAYKIADATITSSESNFNYVEQNYHPRSHILIPNYVETDVFKPLNRTKNRGSICFVGSLYRAKNPLALLEALKGLPYCVDIIGSGPQSSQLQEVARSNGVKASFLGNIPNHELPEILNRHELFVLPSLWEGMPKTLLEAMACGTLPVVTDIPANREWIENGKNGFLVPVDSPEILADTIGRSMEDLDRYESFIERNLSIIKEKGLWEPNMKLLERRFLSLLGQEG